MRVVGKYKNNDIKLEHLAIRDTYGHFLCGIRAGTNKSFFDEHVDSFARNVSSLKYIIVDKEKWLNSSESELPAEMTIAVLRSDMVPGKGEGCWSGAVLVWFEDENLNPIEELEKTLKRLKWEEVASNWWP